MGENTIVGKVSIGTLQNGIFVPLGALDGAQLFTDDDAKPDDAVHSKLFLDGFPPYEVTCDISPKASRWLERTFIDGWRNKMPFRKRLLMKERAKLYKYYIYNTLNFQIVKV